MEARVAPVVSVAAKTGREAIRGAAYGRVVRVGGITHELEVALSPSGPAHCLPALLPPKFY